MSDDDDTARPTIKPRENGSLRVDGLENLLCTRKDTGIGNREG